MTSAQHAEYEAREAVDELVNEYVEDSSGALRALDDLAHYVERYKALLTAEAAARALRKELTHWTTSSRRTS